MKVVQINAVYGATSTGVIAKDLHLLSLHEGIESYVVYSLGNQIPQNGYHIGARIERKWHALLSRICGKMSLDSVIKHKEEISQLSRISDYNYDWEKVDCVLEEYSEIGKCFLNSSLS